MKGKFTILLSALCLILALGACGDDNNGWQDRDVKFNVRLLNHVYDQSVDMVHPLTTSLNGLVFHRADNTADITLVPGDVLPGVSFELKGVLLAIDGESGRYVYKSVETPNPRITNMSYTVDFNEQAIAAHYTIDGNIRVVSKLPQVFYLLNRSVLSYNDDSESVDNASIYQFDIDVKSMTATMHISPLTNTKNVLLFENIIVRGIPVKVTSVGLELEAEHPETVSVYNRIDHETGSLSTTDAADDRGYQKFPITNLKAELTLDMDSHETSFDMGRDDEGTKWNVEAMGSTYSNKK